VGDDDDDDDKDVDDRPYLRLLHGHKLHCRLTEEAVIFQLDG